MGHPKHHKRKYESPRKAYDKDRIEKEQAILKEYGLRRKKEIWRAEGILRNFRQRARDLQARADADKEKILLEKLDKMGVDASTLDEILSISLNNLLDRRLQSLVYKKGMANSIKRARQIIIHGHVSIGERKIKQPSYIVPTAEEKSITVSAAALMQPAEKKGE